ncbi:MAG: hypothetical protein LBK68_00645 [Candidatus Margulisbacteria bacterium]|nr:hypothetical protein [Candidatus Margulisiibacteriota bacterium]
MAEKYPGIKREASFKVATIEAALDNKVSLTWDQTINGTKTFTTSPVVPKKDTAAGNNPTTIATEAQVYKGAYDPLSGLLSLTGNEEIDDTKTFTTSPPVPSKDNTIIDTPSISSAIATEAQIYKMSGDLSTKLNTHIKDNTDDIYNARCW